MTLAEYYDALQRHDWYYAYSDDHSVWLRGEARYDALRKTAETSPEHKALLEAWVAYMNSGPTWGTERAPKPERPKEES